ncbi:3-dehydroquinate synthase [Neobacillus thermocopriae]|uniref:3-dehydroquinate synthase n=1 Tax=Neobacillus thermocopriae TaxID=1215031 RepID=A0A6B3TU98_9BACI|nr:3-dehydroquinate synthase [Neobacillus thermocopriae]MED3625291.1 3-dehydroquinate synthase [Neobacillus thermocopriae]MED3715437.1 3-dehydroquinate synthase [Neobacillus thermocopriae]NEX79849.1 3-dehydroquinate synthase [Neobacillus thermocopriae]
METIHIQTESKNYPVYIGEGVLNKLRTFLNDYFTNLTRIFIITDETVANLHLDKLSSVLNPWNPIIFTTPSGEKAKTFEVFYAALSKALEDQLDRKSVILAFGGGAVGDLSGFVASVFMRGIPFIQIPTTILAHDSAVGGKTAINHPLGKNMIGAFYQPEAVFYDLELLRTLPPQEVRSGFAEVIKHALIHDVDFYYWLKTSVQDLNAISAEQLTELLTKGIRIKNEFVRKDEKETGIRAYLNFGHTLGHAIEAEMGYGSITHGEAVMIGMIFALKLSKQLAGLDFELEEFIEWVEGLGYKTKIPKGLSVENLLRKMKHDKKSIAESIRFVLLESIGRPILKTISDSTIVEEIKVF